jgi:hypothetical protein
MNGWSEDRDMARYEDFGPKPEEEEEFPTVREAVAAVEREVALMHRELDKIDETLCMVRRVLEEERQAS